MMLACPYLDSPIVFDERKVSVLVVENPILLRQTVQAFKGTVKNYVLSEDYNVIELSSHCEFVDNVFDVDFASKSLASKINALANEAAGNYPEELELLCGKINSFGYLIASEMEFSVKYNYVESAERIIKMLNFSIDTEEMQLPEIILEYMNICRKFFKKDFFAFLNLKSFMSSVERDSFYKNVIYEKFKVLLIESHCSSRNPEYENTVIVDNDMCVI